MWFIRPLSGEGPKTLKCATNKQEKKEAAEWTRQIQMHRPTIEGRHMWLIHITITLDQLDKLKKDLRIETPAAVKKEK